MSLDPTLDGDVMKSEGGAFLAISLAKDKSVIGFYALTQQGTYLRGARHWITASGPTLARLNGSKLVNMEESFIDFFDGLDAVGIDPTLAQIKAGSTTGHPASWESQNL